MNKQTTAAVIIILITCLLGYGVTSMLDMTAIERLETIMNSNVNLTSYHMDIEGQMHMGLLSENEIPEYLQTGLKMYDNMNVKINADVVMEPDKVQMKMFEQIDMGGMAFDIEVYLNNDELMVKYPILGDYILISASDMAEALDIELPDNFVMDFWSLMPDIQRDSVEILMSHLHESNVTYVDPFIMTENGYEQTLNVIEIEMDSEMLIQIYADLILKLIENEKGLALLESVIEANGEKLPKAILVDLAELKTTITDVKNPESNTRKELFGTYGPYLNNIHYTYRLGLSNLNIPKMMWINLEMLMPLDDMEDIDMHLKYDLVYKMSQFNEIDQIEMPQIDEENIIRLSDLIKKFGGL